jgi:hypothetical protein
MKLNGQQLGAIFEKLKQAKMGTAAPKVPTPHPKMLNPPMPAMAPKPPSMAGLPGQANPMNANKVNSNYIGNPAQQRFKKIRSMFGI